MSDDILHTIDFVEQEEYQTEKYPDYVFSTSGTMSLPVPSEGELVSFGWHTEDGERVERVDLHAAGHSSSNVGYERSETYEVVSVENHYHMAQKTSDGKLAVNRNEVSTTVVVTKVE
jgi:hypothetical protein